MIWVLLKIEEEAPPSKIIKEISNDRNNYVASLPSASVISQPDFKSDSFQHIFNQNTNYHHDDKDAEDKGKLI